MKIIDTIKNNIIELVFIYSLSVLEVYYILMVLFNIDSSLVLAAFCSLILAAIALTLSTINKKLTVLIYTLAGLGTIAIALFNLEELSEFFNALYLARIDRTYIELGHPIIIAFALSMIFLTVNYLLIKLYNKSIAALIISIALVCTIYFTYNYITVVFEILYLAIILLMFISWLSPKTDNDKNRPSLLPFVFVIAAALIIAPLSVSVSHARQEPLKWIDDIDWFESDEPAPATEFVIRIDGQTKLTSLNDNFNYSDTEMLIVTSPYTDRLKNKTFDLYTRTGWDKALDNEADNQGFQYSNAEFTAILNENNIPYKEYEMTVELSARSQMLFAPLNSSVVTEFEDEMKLSPYDELFFDAPLREEDIYSLDVIKIEYSSDEFIDLITNSQSNNIDNIENYLSISDSLKNELQPLALGLTKDAVSNYEKAKIIESYLSTQFTYTTVPPEKPDSEDFITYFLFETQEGFCTHYASSMVMLLRSIDIPCRFVTGYLLDAPNIYTSIPDDYQEYIPYVQGVATEEYRQQFSFVEGEESEFIVNKDDSHAWVEVWFDDYGWLAFEPTSRYLSPLSAGGTKLEAYDFENIELVTEQEQTTEKENNVLVILSMIVCALLIILVIIRIIITSRRTDSEKIDMLWKGIQKSYYRKMKVSKEHETAREFYMRADQANESLQSALKIYEYVAYSGEDIADWQLIKMQRLNQAIRKTNRRYRRELRRENRPIHNVEPFRPVDD